jgi:hypothetical protein
LSHIENICRDLSASIDGMPSGLTVNLTVKILGRNPPKFLPSGKNCA